MKYFILEILFNRNIQTINRHMLLLSTFSISFLLLIFFYSFDTSSKTSTAVDSRQQNIMKQISTNSKLAQNGKEPIIFSKSQYLNKTPKVKLFSLSHCILYYCLTISAI